MDLTINEKIIEIMEQSGISTYSLAKVTGINRSTLTKALNDGKRFNLRQIKLILEHLPINIAQKKELYNDFQHAKYDKNYLAVNDAILNMFEIINNSLMPKEMKTPNIYININKDINVYKDMNVFKAIEGIFFEELKKNCDAFVGLYLPFENEKIDTILKSIKVVGDNSNGKNNISMLFGFYSVNEKSELKNLITFNNVLPFVLDDSDKYKLYYVYKSYLEPDNLVINPYYIVFKDKLLLINNEIDQMVIVKDKNVIESYRQQHMKNVEDANSLSYSSLSIENTLMNLVNDTISEYTVYAMAYEPCLSCFATLDDYKELIREDYPLKKDVLKMIELRLKQLTSAPSRFAFFNKDSVEEFIKVGNLIPFKHPYLMNCSLEKRKEILTRVLYAIDNLGVDLRAYSYDEIKVSRNFEITNIQNHMNFVILIYYENEIRMINVKEPIISHRLIQFYNDISDSPITMTSYETKKIIKEAINKLDKMIEKEK